MALRIFFQAALTTSLICGQSPAWSVGTLPTCKEVISRQEAEKGIPQDLLKAMAKVESGISPWAINVRGQSRNFRSKEAAAKYMRELVEDGIFNFSIGCMQLHYASHRRHFTSDEAMLEPENNIAHAAKLIKNLERRYGSIDKAVQFYHSASPVHYNRYKKLVYGTWAKFRGPSNPQGALLKTVSLKKAMPQKLSLKAVQRSPKIKFGVGAACAKKNKG